MVTNALSPDSMESSRMAPYFGTSVLSPSPLDHLVFVSARTVAPSIRLNEVVTSLYKLRDHIQVTEFLQENRFLVDLLLEMHPLIQKYFGSHAEVELEMFADPEAETDRRLFALIQTSGAIDDALACLDNFDQWWVTVLPRARRKMSVDVE